MCLLPFFLEPNAIANTCRHSDETVEVGAPLYEIDTDATASVSASEKAQDAAPASKESSPKKETPKPAADKPAAAAKSSHSKQQKQEHRAPRIQFLGKEGWAERLKPAPVVELPPIHPMFGRPKFSEEEMEAIMLGGAEQAPKIVSLSSGATFSY